MTTHRFDDIARMVARLGDSAQSRRSLLRAAGAGGAASLILRQGAAAAPNRLASIRARNQDAAVDPFIDDTAFDLSYDVERLFAPSLRLVSFVEGTGRPSAWYGFERAGS